MILLKRIGGGETTPTMKDRAGAYQAARSEIGVCRDGILLQEKVHHFSKTSIMF